MLVFASVYGPAIYFDAAAAGEMFNEPNFARTT
jgi:hypothetical protein